MPKCWNVEIVIDRSAKSQAVSGGRNVKNAEMDLTGVTSTQIELPICLTILVQPCFFKNNPLKSQMMKGFD
jgi:hypothetical protein